MDSTLNSCLILLSWYYILLCLLIKLPCFSLSFALQSFCCIVPFTLAFMYAVRRCCQDNSQLTTSWVRCQEVCSRRTLLQQRRCQLCLAVRLQLACLCSIPQLRSAQAPVRRWRKRSLQRSAVNKASPARGRIRYSPKQKRDWRAGQPCSSSCCLIVIPIIHPSSPSIVSREMGLHIADEDEQQKKTSVKKMRKHDAEEKRVEHWVERRQRKRAKKEEEAQKRKRTVFVGNLPSSCSKKVGWDWLLHCGGTSCCCGKWTLSRVFRPFRICSEMKDPLSPSDFALW